jgi:hypothetical protein
MQRSQEKKLEMVKTARALEGELLWYVVQRVHNAILGSTS